MKKFFKLKNFLFLKIIVILFFLPLLLVHSIHASNNVQEPFATELRSRGFSLIPAPQKAEVGKLNVSINESWSIENRTERNNSAYNRIIHGAQDLHNLSFNSKSQSKKIVLDIRSGTVNGTDDPDLNAQGYLLKISPEVVEITGNSETGLFYGVQSFLQLLKKNPAGGFTIPECTITDWPSLELRFVHWDTKHHQKRIETLKRLIDWHAYFKVNMISFEMEDKYEYPSHPIIGAPGAYSKEEMQDLTRYALERHIQIVPNIQAPAHMTYVLKHEEFAHLKSDGSNYQACMCDPEAINLILDIYQDMIDATPGVDYFHVSTDEIYYAGICDKCDAPYNDENRSLAWVEFATMAHDWLAERGRRMIAWVEYPLLTKHISMLPPGIINGIGGEKAFIEEEQKIGMRQLVYSSTQGSEYLFPNHLPTANQNIRNSGRLLSHHQKVRSIITNGANPIGTFAAAWDDSGLHEETFHLGWATVTQYGWTPYWPTVEQSTADFMDVFYGYNSPDMTSIYYQLIEGAQFFSGGWDKVNSTERSNSYGNSRGKGIGTQRSDDILVMPGVPEQETLKFIPEFTNQYKDLIDQASVMKVKNDELINKITRYMTQVERNQYNLDVFLSIAYLQRYFINTVLAVNKSEQQLVRAFQAAQKENFADAVSLMVEASNTMDAHINWGNWMWANLESVWEISRYKKGRSMDGRHFVHIMDDVKDHWADRRPGLDYMIAPFQRLKMTEWKNKINEQIYIYASAHNVPVTGIEEERLED